MHVRLDQFYQHKYEGVARGKVLIKLIQLMHAWYNFRSPRHMYCGLIIAHLIATSNRISYNYVHEFLLLA